MKRTLALLIVLLMLSAFGCGPVPEDRSAEGEGIVTISTPIPGSAAPTVSFSAEPSGGEGTEAPSPSDPVQASAAPTAVPPIPANADQAVAMYEGYPLGYTPLSRPSVGPNAPIPAPRYTLGDDGIYRSSSPAVSENEAVLMFTGDLMCQARQQLACRKGSGYDFSESFDYVKDLFGKADLVVGNLEATLSASAPYMSEQTYVDGSPHLNAPANFLEAVRGAGYDMVVTSNNHNCDAGVRGIYDTLDAVDQYGLIHTGTFRNANELRYSIVEVNGIRIGFMSYATYFNHKEEHLSNEGRAILLNRYSAERVERDVQAVRAAGAEYVMVYIHWGVEYKNDPRLVFSIPMTEKLSGKEFTLRAATDVQPGMAQELADAGVDYILGSHPHALQPYDVITASDGRKVPVIYSLGNFVSHQKKDVSKDTMILRIALTRDASGRIGISREGYVPARMHVSYNGRSYTVLPVTAPYRRENYSSEFAPAYYRITSVVGTKLAVMGTL